MLKRTLLKYIVSTALLFFIIYNPERGYSITSTLPTISALERYQKGEGINTSQIPQIYDISKLSIGSGVEYEITTMINYGSGEQKFKGEIGYRLKDVRSDNLEKIYQIEFYSSDGMKGIIELDRFTIPHGLIQDLHLVRYLENNYHHDFVQRDGTNYFFRNMSIFLQSGLAGILIDTVMSSLAEKKMEQSKKDFAKCLMDWSNRPKELNKDVNKILIYGKIGTEDLIVQNAKIVCEIYEIQAIEKVQSFSTISDKPGECIKGAVTISEWFIKVWISRDIPFGIVKAEITQIDQGIDSVKQFKTNKTFMAKEILIK